MDKRKELLSKYFADLSKIFFATGIAKQIMSSRYNMIELTFGLFSSMIMLIIAYFIQPKE